MITAVKLSPTDRRLAAVRAVTDLRCKDGQAIGTREEIAADIEKLATLGRTQRWTETVAGWADMVRDTANEPHWALVQGSVFTGYAAL